MIRTEPARTAASPAVPTMRITIYISTRSVGYDQIDCDYAESVGISVETVAYSPDSVADYTLMLMLMAVRHAKSVIRRADVHDYRLHDVRGRELRDLAIGVIGTGRIGGAVMDRLRGFGCRTLAYDTRPGTSADHVTLGALLEQSDIVTLHTPLTPQTHHLLDRRRIERMKRGAVIVNTGRGALLDTEALVWALKAADWAARRWTSSKARKASSTPTAATSRSKAGSCCGCTSCRTC